MQHELCTLLSDVVVGCPRDMYGNGPVQPIGSDCCPKTEVPLGHYQQSIMVDQLGHLLVSHV